MKCIRAFALKKDTDRSILIDLHSNEHFEVSLALGDFLLSYAHGQTFGISPEASAVLGILRNAGVKLAPEDAVYFRELGSSTCHKLLLRVTTECNLKCIHCSVELPQRPQHLSLGAIKKAVLDLVPHGLYDVHLSGGEIFAYPEIYDLLRFLGECPIAFGVITNAVSLDDRAIESLVEAHPHSVVVSLDGMARVHDQIRGAGTFLRTTNAIRRLVDCGLTVKINTLLIDESVSSLQEFKEYCLGDLCVNEVIPFFCVPKGRAIQNWDFLQVRDVEMIRSMCKSEGKQFHARLHQEGLPCLALREQIFVDADGTAFPCPALDTFPLGSIHDSSLAEIWLRARAQSDLLTYSRASLTKCDTCASWDDCRGGCRGRAIAQGNANGPDLFNCFLNETYETSNPLRFLYQ